MFGRARLAHLRGDLGTARKLIAECLETLPGDDEFYRYAVQTGAEVPATARKIGEERARWARALASRSGITSSLRAEPIMFAVRTT